jgi:hypothetical protein
MNVNNHCVGRPLVHSIQLSLTIHPEIEDLTATVIISCCEDPDLPYA